MFERYTQASRRVIFFARLEASNFGSMTLETEHLLLGLIREDKNLMRHFLRNHSAIESIRKETERRITSHEEIPTSIDLPLSNEFTRILTYAAEEAARLNHLHIGTEHLLLGILREERCVAAEILHERGFRLDTMREQLARVSMAQEQGATGPAKQPIVEGEGKRELYTDADTGLYNKRFFVDVLKGELALPERDRQPLTLLILNVDHMKSVNDTFGHAAGNEVLKLVATILRSSIGHEDFAFRCGGDEFAVLLPGKDLKVGLDIAEHIRGRCETHLGQAMTPSISVTISIGVCEYEPAIPMDTLMDRASQALHKAKMIRNTVAFHPKKGRSSGGSVT